MWSRICLPLPDHLISPLVFGGVCVAYSLFLCCVMCAIVCLFVFFIFSHGVVSLFSIYEFDCPSGIFRPCFLVDFIFRQEMPAIFINSLIGLLSLYKLRILSNASWVIFSTIYTVSESNASWVIFSKVYTRNVLVG